MALRIYNTLTVDKVKMKQGNIYEFRYSPYENDPNPMIIFINGIKGLHPNTGHQWRLIQGINLNYIPRGARKQFINIWKSNIEKGKPAQFTWEIVKRKFPYLKDAIRRYNLKPNYYIRNLKHIEFKDLEKEVIRSFHRDFSKMLKRRLGSKLKKFFVGRRK